MGYSTIRSKFAVKEFEDWSTCKLVNLWKYLVTM